MTDSIIRLKDKKPLFENGRHRAVYLHPENDNLLIKVVRPNQEERYSRDPKIKRIFRSTGATSINLYEFTEALRKHLGPEHKQPHIFTPVSLSRTDMGWGLICEVERHKDGSFARNLLQLKDELKDYREAFQQFHDWIHQTDTIITGIKLENIVMSWRDNKPELVIIDGIGRRHTVFLRPFFASINRSKNIKRFHKIMRAANLDKVWPEMLKS